ncbi:MAG: flagellar motor switch protein FliM [Fibrobacterales bacterium]
MSDILSQEEVDALLSAVSGGDMAEDDGSAELSAAPVDAAGPVFSPDYSDYEEEEQRAVALYDFKRPDRVSKDQVRTLQNLHEGYARLLSTTLTSLLRTLVEIELSSVDQLTYQEVIMSISTPSCIYIFQMEPLEGNAILEVNPSLIFIMLDRLFGGQGRTIDSTRELTDIERAVITKIIERALLDLKEVWENIGIFSPKIDSYETNPQFVQIAPPGETVILIALEVRMKNGSGLMSLCFPFILLESILEKLSGESWISAQKTTTQETRRLVEKELGDTTVGVAASIGDTSLSVRDFLQLEKNDVLVLDKSAGSDLVVSVGGRPKFLGKPGVVGRKKSIQITSIIDREVGSDE